MMSTRPSFSSVVLACVTCLEISASAQTDVDVRARAIHQRILVIDSHTDVLLPTTAETLYLPGHGSRVDLDKLQRGGIGAVAMAIAVGSGPRTAEGAAAAPGRTPARPGASATPPGG